MRLAKNVPESFTHNSMEINMHSLRSILSRAQVTRSKPLFAFMTPLILAGALSSCATFDKCGFAGCPGDAQITANVQAQLDKHPELGAPDQVYVRTLNHVVYLNGEVSSGLQSQVAESVAMKVKGVDRVDNSIGITK
jgi:hypothetical protein